MAVSTPTGSGKRPLWQRHRPLRPAIFGELQAVDEGLVIPGCACACHVGRICFEDSLSVTGLIRCREKGIAFWRVVALDKRRAAARAPTPIAFNKAMESVPVKPAPARSFHSCREITTKVARITSLPAIAQLRRPVPPTDRAGRCPLPAGPLRPLWPSGATAARGTASLGQLFQCAPCRMRIAPRFVALTIRASKRMPLATSHTTNTATASSASALPSSTRAPAPRRCGNCIEHRRRFESRHIGHTVFDGPVAKIKSRLAGTTGRACRFPVSRPTSCPPRDLPALPSASGAADCSGAPAALQSHAGNGARSMGSASIIGIVPAGHEPLTFWPCQSISGKGDKRGPCPREAARNKSFDGGPSRRGWVYPPEYATRQIAG